MWATPESRRELPGTGGHRCRVTSGGRNLPRSTEVRESREPASTATTTTARWATRARCQFDRAVVIQSTDSCDSDGAAAEPTPRRERLSDALLSRRPLPRAARRSRRGTDASSAGMDGRQPPSCPAEVWNAGARLVPLGQRHRALTAAPCCGPEHDGATRPSRAGGTGRCSRRLPLCGRGLRPRGPRHEAAPSACLPGSASRSAAGAQGRDQQRLARGGSFLATRCARRFGFGHGSSAATGHRRRRQG